MNKFGMNILCVGLGIHWHPFTYQALVQVLDHTCLDRLCLDDCHLYKHNLSDQIFLHHRMTARTTRHLYCTESICCNPLQDLHASKTLLHYNTVVLGRHQCIRCFHFESVQNLKWKYWSGHSILFFCYRVIKQSIYISEYLKLNNCRIGY